MRIKVRKVGNSLTVTIPREIALDLDIDAGTEMDVSVGGQAVVFALTQDRWARLLAQVRLQAVERGLSETDVDLAIADLRGRQT